MRNDKEVAFIKSKVQGIVAMAKELERQAHDALMRAGTPQASEEFCKRMNLVDDARQVEKWVDKVTDENVPVRVDR